jgi:hypothetical protein
VDDAAVSTPDRDKIAKALDALDLESLEDYDSDDFEDDDGAKDADAAAARGRNAYVAGLWSRYGMSEQAASQESKIIQAHKMVQGFVDTFATDGRYRVTFDPGISTAGTDLIGHRIVITPAPLFDKNLPADKAAVILTAMATHEICHPRYGRSTAAAVRRIFGNKRAPSTLSNLLDDVRIERRFADDYPGYADVFRPMLEGRRREATDVRPREPRHHGDQVPELDQVGDRRDPRRARLVAGLGGTRGA